MSDTEVSRLFGFLSPVATIRAIVSSVWSPMDSVLQRLLGIPRKIGSFCSGCVRRAISPFTSIFTAVQNPLTNSTQVPNLPHLLTGVPNPTSQQVADQVRVIQNCTINTIINQISHRNKLQEYRNELQKWKEENEKEMVDLFNLGENDKIRMKTLALSVKKLRVLKAKKTKLNTEKMLKMVSKDSITSENLKLIQNSSKSLNEIESDMIKNKKECLDTVKASERLGHLFTKVLLHSDCFYDLDSDMPVVNKLRAITYKSQMENDAVKSSLVVTNEKLDKLLNATEKISTALADIKENTDIPSLRIREYTDIPSLRNELVALRSQLEQDQLILRNIKGERDALKVKLDVLEDLIEDQENFLNSRENNPETENAVVQ